MDMTAWGEFSPMLVVAWGAGRCGSSVLLFPGRDACWAWRAFSTTSSHWALAVSIFFVHYSRSAHLGPWQWSCSCSVL